MRIAATDGIIPPAQCSRCPAANSRWDTINAVAYCPNCQEEMVQGEGAPLTLRTAKHRCTACQRHGTVCYQTYPLGAPAPVAMEVCAKHLRDLLGRRLDPLAYHHFRRQLQVLGFQVEDVFLLHGAFYDAQGTALHPILDMDPKPRRAG